MKRPISPQKITGTTGERALIHVLPLQRIVRL